MDKYELNLEIPWEEVKEKLKEVNNELTDEDLDFDAGHEKELLERLSGKLERPVPEIKAWIESVAFNSGIAS